MTTGELADDTDAIGGVTMDGLVVDIDSGARITGAAIVGVGGDNFGGAAVAVTLIAGRSAGVEVTTMLGILVAVRDGAAWSTVARAIGTTGRTFGSGRWGVGAPALASVVVPPLTRRLSAGDGGRNDMGVK